LITKAQLLTLYAEVYELEHGSGWLCKHAKRGWVVLDAAGKEVAV
jgi:hypothetical protein